MLRASMTCGECKFIKMHRHNRFFALYAFRAYVRNFLTYALPSTYMFPLEMKFLLLNFSSKPLVILTNIANKRFFSERA